MDITLNHTAIFPRGRRAQDVGGQQMADNIAKTVVEVLSTGTVTAIATYVLTRSKDRQDSVEKRIQAEIDARAVTTEAHNAVLERVTKLETRMDAKDKQIGELSSDKLKLEAQVFTLEHQIAELNVQITKYQQNEIAFHATIAELQARLASKSTELHTVQSRLQAIKDAADRGEVLKSVLFQGQRHAEVIDVVEVELDPD